MRIVGLEGIGGSQLAREVERGGKWAVGSLIRNFGGGKDVTRQVLACVEPARAA